ncbi:unnamed protein product [Effrenium voratum]|uniref:Pentatricopeptide repeat-containing protein, chloroplastic n=1 Tax=Effrenium voratum TaxID=2562239 RepID=A0AA36ITZ4_9DINO|nr:unnamed protein product [Effrenium voratum]
MELRGDLKTSTRHIAQLGRWAEALRFLEQVPQPNAFVYSAAISACERSHCWQHALQLLEDMGQRRVRADVVCCGGLLSACEKGQQWPGALQLLQDMREAQILPNLISYSSALSACEKGQKWEHALLLFWAMTQEGLEQDVVSCSAAISACEKGQQWSTALSLLAAMLSQRISPNAYTFNSAISACEKGLQWECALQLLEDMAINLLPDTITFAAALSACQKCLRWEPALELLKEMRRRGVQEGLMTYNAAMSALCQNWKLATSLLRQLQESLLVPDVVSFSAVASACDRAGRWESAVRLFEELQELSTVPNMVFCSHAIGACATCSAWRPALQLLQQAEDLGLEVDVVACTATLEACCQGGQVPFALQLLQDMRRHALRPNVVSYAAVLGGCERHQKAPETLCLLGECLSSALAMMPSIASSRRGGAGKATSLIEGEAASYGATGAANGSKTGIFRFKWSWPSCPLSPPLVAECLGTFCLVLAVGCLVTGPGPAPWVPTAIAAVLMVMVYATGPISGGNLNPAVSLALAISGKLTWTQMLKYWAAQLLGGFLGAGAYRGLCYPNFVMVAPIAPFGPGSCFTAELIYTFMLCFVVLNCAASRRNNPKDDPNQFFGLAIGFVIVAGGHAVGGVSGAALNPAVALSLGTTSGKDIYWPWLWSAAELLGAAVAAGAFRLLRGEEFAQDATEESLEKHETGLLMCCAAELLGTFMLVFTVGMNLVATSPSVAFSAAAALMCMIYSLGNISGAHLNPAVTLAVTLRGKCSYGKAACYVLAQLLGGIFAGLSYAAFHGVSSNNRKSIQLAFGKHYDIWQASFAELLFTMILAYVVLAVATTEKPAEWKTKQNFYFGLAIGSCVTAGGFAAGAISGGELNPAVAVGIYLANVVNPGRLGIGPFVNLVCFSLFQLLGGAFAAGLFRLTHGGAAGKSKEEEKIVEAEAPAETVLEA